MRLRVGNEKMIMKVMKEKKLMMMATNGKRCVCIFVVQVVRLGCDVFGW